MSPGIPTRLLATLTDERLLALVGQGHERAFEALVHRYRKPLLIYCRRLSLPEARAEDVVQLALLKTWIAVGEGVEVRDLKAWLYRVVHNTAVNALRDAAHEGEPLTDLALGSGSLPPLKEPQLDQGLAVREALAEVAALPEMQREVIVRTAVAGHSHEQVASDLGISDGAVRGLLYRARATLRTAITALIPPPLFAWLAGRSDQGAPAPERLTELAGGGGAAGLGGLLLKGGGVVALTAGTVITGAAVVHIGGSHHHHPRPELIAVTVSASTRGPGGGSPLVAQADSGGRYLRTTANGSRSHRGARSGGGRSPGVGIHASSGGGSAKSHVLAPGGSRAPRSTTRTPDGAQGGAPGTVRIVQSAPPPSGSAPGSSQSAGSPQGGESSAGSGGPVGSVAASGTGSGGSPGQGSAEEPGGASSGGEQSGGGSGSGGKEGSSSQGSSGGSSGSSGSGESSGSSGSGGSSGSESSGGSKASGGSNSEQSGSLVGTVVHEVGGILEHLLH
jgi:RNA polymerase sigma factor (sigma-70 family)